MYLHWSPYSACLCCTFLSSCTLQQALQRLRLSSNCNTLESEQEPHAAHGCAPWHLLGLVLCPTPCLLCTSQSPPCAFTTPTSYLPVFCTLPSSCTQQRAPQGLSLPQQWQRCRSHPDPFAAHGRAPGHLSKGHPSQCCESDARAALAAAAEAWRPGTACSTGSHGSCPAAVPLQHLDLEDGSAACRLGHFGCCE